MSRPRRYAAGLAVVAAVAAPVAVHQATARCERGTAICHPDNRANPDRLDDPDLATSSTFAPVPAAAAPAGRQSGRPVGLVEQVRDATRAFQDVNKATAAGYASLGACVSGPEEGAMGIHYGGQPIDDGVLRPDQPELLIYEQHGGRLSLVGVEYLQLAAGWKGPPPVLVGQQFQFVDAPNRYGLDPFYELHVWAWKNNPKGTFADWNPKVSCDEYTGDTGAVHHH